MLHIQVPELVEEDAAPPPPVDGRQPGRADDPRSRGREVVLLVDAEDPRVAPACSVSGGLAVGSIFGLKTMSGACADGPKASAASSAPRPIAIAHRATGRSRRSASSPAARSSRARSSSGSTAPTGKKVGRTLVPSIGAGWAGLNGTF